MIKLPRNDDYMTYNIHTHRYVLTEKFVMDNFGFSLATKYQDEITRHLILDKASREVYRYMHKFNDSQMQDFIIAKTESGRALIQDCMAEQLLDSMVNGGLIHSTDENKRKFWISEGAKSELEERILPEIGSTITYTGLLQFCCNDESEW